MSDSVTVGVLSFHNSKETKAICNAVDALGHEAEWLRSENLSVRTDDGPSPPADVVINRLLVPSMARPLDGLGLVSAIESTTPVLNPAEAVLTATHKFSAATRLVRDGLPVPDAVLAVGNDHLPGALTGDEPERRVFKFPIGTHGDATQILDAEEAPPLRHPPAQGLVQKPIDPPGDTHEDLRVYVVGDEVVGAMRRHAAFDDWRTNVARGGRVRDATDTLPEHVLDTAIDAVDALDLDIGGVDIIEGADGWYILEVNVTAGFKGLYSATGRSPAPYIARLAIERAGGNVDDELVEELAADLDDSVPTCKPALDRVPDPGERTVGYTEPIQIGGTSGSETVVAKADTGATRSSVDIALASEIGAGPILDSKTVKGGDDGSPRPIVPVTMQVQDTVHEVEVNVRDRSHLNHDVLLGRDILEHYDVRVSSRSSDSAPPTFAPTRRDNE